MLGWVEMHVMFSVRRGVRVCVCKKVAVEVLTCIYVKKGRHIYSQSGTKFRQCNLNTVLF